MADIPEGIQWGVVTARFGEILSDSPDAERVPDLRDLTGEVVLTPSVRWLQVPNLPSGGRRFHVATLTCPVLGGVMYPPGTELPAQDVGVPVVATAQPGAIPELVQWTAEFRLDGVAVQPSPVTFDVPAGGTVDLATQMGSDEQVPYVTVVSVEDRIRAEDAAALAEQWRTLAAQSATAADASADAAAQSVTDATAQATAAATARTGAETARTGAETARTAAEAARDTAVAAADTATAPTDQTMADKLADPASMTGVEFRERVGYRVSVLTHGAVADGTTDDFAAFDAARTAAGAEGVVYFPARPGAAETVYQLGGASRVSLAGSRIETDPGVVLRGRFDPGVKTWKAITPLVIDNLEHANRLTKPAPAPASPYAAAAAVVPDGASLRALAFSTSFTAEGFGGGFAPYTPVANGAQLGTSETTWPTGFAGSAGYEGVVTTPVIGEFYETTVVASQNNTAAYSGMLVVSSDNHIAGFRNAPGSSTWSGIGSTSLFATLGSYALNALYASQVNGVTMGIRVLNNAAGLPRVVEFYANGKLFARRETLKDIAKVAFVITSTDATGKKLQYPVAYGKGYVPSSTHRVGTCSVIGDSISYGAWNTVTWPDLLNTALGGLPNGGHVTVRQNLAVSGTSAQDWAPGGSQDITLKSFTGDRYVLVLLGTNDGATRDPQAFLDNLTSIAAKITGDGAIPIFGVFPLWSNQALSGIQGVATASPSAVQRLRAALTYWASTSANKFELALVQHAFGDVHEWLGDNIHPTEIGQAAIARAFANAIARAETKRLTA